jgi:hypothetical protein
MDQKYRDLPIPLYSTAGDINVTDMELLSCKVCTSAVRNTSRTQGPKGVSCPLDMYIQLVDHVKYDDVYNIVAYAYARLDSPTAVAGDYYGFFKINYVSDGSTQIKTLEILYMATVNPGSVIPPVWSPDVAQDVNSVS